MRQLYILLICSLPMATWANAGEFNRQSWAVGLLTEELSLQAKKYMIKLPATIAAPNVSQSPNCKKIKIDLKSFTDNRIVYEKNPSQELLMANLKFFVSQKPLYQDCLLNTLLSKTATKSIQDPFEPIYLLKELSSNTRNKQRTFHQLLLTLRYVQIAQYPEALRSLMELHSRTKRFKDHYDAVQRLYARHQKSAGKVALKQSL